ncbi:MAG: VIT1/CCC1 transporter family protein [Marmoricola sp.]
MTSAPNPSAEFEAAAEDHDEPHDAGITNRLNWLRAAVLGANDGIVSVAGIVLGVAGATSKVSTIAVAGIAGLTAGALSMAVGEYVSVSTQRDTEQALLAKEAAELRDDAEFELEELTQIYRDKGLSDGVARQVAQELTEHDALRAHAEAELGIDPDDLTNPWSAAIASMISFTIGALLPLIAIVVIPDGLRVPLTVLAVVLALAITGVLSANAGGAGRRRAVFRNVFGGLLAMVVTYAIGSLVGTRVS